MAERVETPADPGTAFQLGKIEGQLRELIHTQNNQAMKGDAVAEKLSKLESLPKDIGEIKTTLTSLDTRLTALEHDRQRREGAMNLGAWLVKSPLVAWLAAAALLAWTWLKENGQ